MQTTYTSHTTFHPAMMPPGNMRLNWLTFENTAAAKHDARFRYPGHEDDLAMMRRPLTSQKVYQWLGLMLGLAPPAAVFARMFRYGIGYAFGDSWGPALFFLCLMMNLVCGLMGFFMGGVFSSSALSAVRMSRTRMVLFLALLGATWGVTTGGLGGLFFFGFGALFGMMFAVPIGIASFVTFGALHRWLERGGMIEARHFWPLAIGIVSTITVLISAV